MSGGQDWEPGFLASSQVIYPLKTILLLTSSLYYKEIMCPSQKLVLCRNERGEERGRVKVGEGEDKRQQERREGRRRSGKEKERFQPSFNITV